LLFCWEEEEGGERRRFWITRDVERFDVYVITPRI
jgi:hypothetical protein